MPGGDANMSDQVIAIIFFVAIIALTLGITAWAARQNTDTSHHYVAGGEIKGWQNGLAISGDYLSAASFLGIAGAIALTGFSGFYLSIGFLVAYLVVLLLVAEPLRNMGKYTLADMLASRFNASSVRSVSALSTITISMFYMIAQLNGSGALIGLLLGLPYWFSVIVIGILMTVYIVAGGMIATTWIQIIKALLLIAGTLTLSILVLARYGFNPLALFAAVDSKIGGEFLVPPPPSTLVAGLDVISLNIALVLGTAGLPHILIRFLTVPDAKTARSSIVTATWIIGLFYLLTPILGYGAALFVGQDAISEANVAGNLAAPSANVPVILLTIFWKRFNTTGAITGMLLGLISAVVLVIISPNVFTGPNPEPPATPIITIDPLFPLKSPALISVPLGFLGCYLGTLLGGRGAEREREQGIQKSSDEIRVSSLTGITDIEQEIREATPEEEPRPT